MKPSCPSETQRTLKMGRLKPPLPWVGATSVAHFRMKRTNLHGFTLLEVMVALLIIATSFIVLLHSRNQSVVAADYARHTTIATLLASEKMSEIEGKERIETGEDSGVFDDNYPEYAWRTTISETAYENIREIRVEVLWGEGKSQRSIEIVNYVKEKEL